MTCDGLLDSKGALAAVDAEPLVDFPRRLPAYPKAPGRPRVGIVHVTSVYADEGAVEWSCSCGDGGEEATRGEAMRAAARHRALA